MVKFCFCATFRNSKTSDKWVNRQCRRHGSVKVYKTNKESEIMGRKSNMKDVDE